LKARPLCNQSTRPTVPCTNRHRSADAAKVSREVKGHLPGAEKEAKKDTEVLAAEAGKKFDNTVADAKAGVSKIDSKLEGYRKDAEKTIDRTAKDARNQANAAIDKFDKSVTEVSISYFYLGGCCDRC
jgi:ElaB/YqjD/DUF883 family membrane-anchored ribosome-binding protein